jgi:hypothetical protein
MDESQLFFEKTDNIHTCQMIAGRITPSEDKRKGKRESFYYHSWLVKNTYLSNIRKEGNKYGDAYPT